MKHVWREALTNRIPATPLARRTIRATALIGITIGILLIAGGPNRMTGPAYTVVRQIPHAHIFWGGLFLTCGLTIAVASHLRHWAAKAIGLFALAVCAFLFALGVIGAALTVPTAGLIGGPLFCYLGVTATILIWVNENDAAPARP